MRTITIAVLVATTTLGGCYLVEDGTFPDYGDKTPLKEGVYVCTGLNQPELSRHHLKVTMQEQKYQYAFIGGKQPWVIAFTATAIAGEYVMATASAPASNSTGQPVAAAIVTESSLTVFAIEQARLQDVADKYSVRFTTAHGLPLTSLIGSKENVKRFMLESTKRVEGALVLVTCSYLPRG